MPPFVSKALGPNASWLDRVGSISGTVCALHCLACALAPGLLAIAGLDVLLDHDAEWVFTIVAVAVALAAAGFSHRIHGSRRITATFIGCAAALGLARFLEVWGLGTIGALVAVGSGLGLVVTHVVNHRVCRGGVCSTG